jgi:hypothetical protein
VAAAAASHALSPSKLARLAKHQSPIAGRVPESPSFQQSMQ